MASFNVCTKLLQMFYQAARVLFYAVVFWGGSTRKKDNKWTNKIIRKEGFVVGMDLDTMVAEKGSRQLLTMSAALCTLS